MSAKYDYSKALHLKDLLSDSRCKMFDLSVVPAKKGRKARNIAGTFLRMVVLDAIENDTLFISPNKDFFTLQVKEKTQKSVIHILKKISKAYTGVDLIKSEGKFYEFYLYSKHIPGRNRALRIGYKDYQNLIKGVNEGMRYSK